MTLCHNITKSTTHKTIQGRKKQKRKKEEKKKEEERAKSKSKGKQLSVINPALSGITLLLKIMTGQQSLFVSPMSFVGSSLF